MMNQTGEQGKQNVTAQYFSTMVIQNHGQRRAIVRCCIKASVTVYQVWLEQRHRQGSEAHCAAANLASTELRQRHSKCLQIQRQITSRKHSKGKSEDKGKGQVGYKLKRNKNKQRKAFRPEDQKHYFQVQMQASRSTQHCNQCKVVLLFYLNSIKVDSNPQALNASQ